MSPTCIYWPRRLLLRSQVGGRRFAVALYSILATLLYTSTTNWMNSSRSDSTITTFHDLTPIKATPKGHLTGQKLLILTPLKDASEWLDEYFDNLSRYDAERWDGASLSAHCSRSACSLSGSTTQNTSSHSHSSSLTPKMTQSQSSEHEHGDSLACHLQSATTRFKSSNATFTSTSLPKSDTASKANLSAERSSRAHATTSSRAR